MAQSEIDYTGLSKREERALRRLYKDYDYKYGKRGYFGQVSVDASYYIYKGFLLNDMMYGVDVVNGYSFGPHFDLGGGIGFYCQPNSAKNKRYYIAPLFVYTRVNILQRKVTPYIAAKLGWGYAWGGDVDCSDDDCRRINGLSTYSAGELGVKVHLPKGMALTVGVSSSLYFIPLFASSLGVNVGFTW